MHSSRHAYSINLTGAVPLHLGQLRRACVGVLAALAAMLASPIGFAAAPPEMLFVRLGSDAGLSPGAIMSIAQDAQGFIWFGTEDGLDRFDGYELRHFIHNRSDKGSLPNNWVGALKRDAAGRLWVGSDGGLVWRDSSVARFSRPELKPTSSPIDPNSRVQTLHVDRSGRLWIGTPEAGVRVLSAVSATLQEFRHDAAHADSLSADAVFAIADDPSGLMWVGTDNGLDRLDPRTGHAEHFAGRLRGADAPADRPVRVNALLVDQRDVLWIGMDSGLAKLDLHSGALDVLRHRDEAPGTLPKGRITSLLEDDAQRLWVGTTDGLALLDRRTDEFVVMRHDATDSATLPDSHVTSLFQDRSGLLWIGTKSGGVARWNPRSWAFGHHRFADDGASNVTSFAVDHRGMLWVGSYGAGVTSVDPSSGAVTRYRRGNGSKISLNDDAVMAMVADDRNRIWLGTMSKGIQRIDPAHGETRSFDPVPNDPSTLPASGIMSLLRDSRGRIWIGTFGGGLARIDPESDKVVRYPYGRKDESGLAGDQATALAEDRTGLIWIGTDGDGLSVLNPMSGRFVHYMHDARMPSSLSSNTIYSLHVDDQGTVWVGTRGGGMDRVAGTPFSKDYVRFENMSESEGLPNSSVYGIESDAHGQLWVSTNRGLAVVEFAPRSVRSFRRSHGLQGDEFNFGAHYRAPDGTLYFGGANGFNAFQPERLQLNDIPPPVVLTQVLTLNKPVSPVPELMHALDLGYRDSVVTFQFAALDYSGPAENRYAYRLKGFDADWVSADGSRQATYTNLDGGNYEFQVRAANNDGRWNDTPTSLAVHIAPPPWATWWARTLYAGVLGAIVFMVWLAQQRKIEREAAFGKQLQWKVDERTQELAERNRDMERANEQLRAASVTDTLTGLGNRRCLHDAMAIVLKRAADEPPARFVLMIIDLDYLKPINDHYGHEAGDAVLIQVATILRREFRTTDLIVRWGGDEFVVLCMDADLAAAGDLAERVRLAISKQIFRIGDGPAARTSCSIGFAPMPFIPEHPQLLDWEQTLGIADVALYHAKRDRNTWLGWSGTEKMAGLPSIAAALSEDSAVLEKEGLLHVHRRPFKPDETVEIMRILRRQAAP